MLIHHDDCASRKWPSEACDCGVEIDAEAGLELIASVRRVSSEITGGNCSFVDDDLTVISVLARNAAEAGLMDGLSPSIQRSIDRAQDREPS